jgi:hypothetical protein
MSFAEAAFPAGRFLANTVGSVHQSFTTPHQGALVVVLWSGCHANIRPAQCSGLTAPGAGLLRPGEGWATA